MMKSASHRTGCGGRLVLLLGGVLLAGVLWHSRQDRIERSLTSLGAEVYYERAERAALLSRRLAAAGGKTAPHVPRMIDRLFGQIVTVHFGRTTDLRGVDPAAVVKAVLALPDVRTVLIDGVLLRDADLLRLVESPSLVELGLKNTETTAVGIAAARAKRPTVEIRQLEIQ